MPATNQNFTVYTGDTRTIRFTVEAGGEVETLVGALVRWWAARSAFTAPDNADIKKSSEAGDGIAIIDAAGLVFEVTLDPADTQNLIGPFYHEAEITDAAGNVSTVAVGRMTVEKALIGPESP